MRETISNLLKLQELDSFIDDLSRKMDHVPRKLSVYKQHLDDAMEAVTSEKAVIQEHELEKRRIEHQIEELDEHIIRFQNQLNGVKTNEEYRALLNQIDRSNEKKRRFEDDLLNIMEQIEEDESSLKKVENDLRTAETEYKEREKEATELLEKLEEGITEKTRVRHSIFDRLTPILQKRYTRIRENTNGIAVATVEGEVCSGCHGAIPPQRINEIRRSDQTYSCQHCGRILLWKD